MANEETKDTKKKGGKVTQKQIYLLVGLCIVLVIFLAVQFLIRPMLTTISEDQESVDSLSTKYDSLLQQSQSYGANMTQYNSANTKFTVEKSNLFKLMDSDTVDKTITPLIKSMGFEVSSVSITDLNAFFIDDARTLTNSTMKYYEALEYSEVETVEETTESAILETEADNGDVTYGEAKEALENDGSSGEAAESKTYNTGEYYYSLTYSLTGSYADIVTLVHNITRDVALSIESLSFQSVSDETTEIQGDYTVNVVINVYMYEDPSTGVNDEVEVETDENGEPVAEGRDLSGEELTSESES